MRTLTIGRQAYRYRIGRGSAVIEGPGWKDVVPLTTLTGRSPDTLERGRWKRTRDGMVTPVHVRDYILNRNRSTV
jgi:hypothetical protein